MLRPHVNGLYGCDLACGSGYYTQKIQELTGKKMIGMDVSSDMVELGKYMYKDKDLELIVNDCSAEQPRFKDSFDFIHDVLPC